MNFTSIIMSFTFWILLVALILNFLRVGSDDGKS